MFEKVKRWFNAFMYSIPYAMKGAEDEIFGNSSKGSAHGTEIAQEVSDKRVANHLLKGEVTQSVEELRYRTYKVSEESEKYAYVGNGMVVKKDGTVSKSRNGKYKFSQENSLKCASITEEFKHMDDYGVEMYTIEISYTRPTRFKFEEHISSIFVDIDDSKGLIETKLQFSMYPNKYKVSSKPLIKSLEALVNDGTKGEFMDSIDALSLTTYRAKGENDFVTYTFEKPKFKEASLDVDKGVYALVYVWESYARVGLDLSAKYYSKEMDEKYKRKEKKERLVSENSERYCSMCAKPLKPNEDTFCGECRKLVEKNLSSLLTENGLEALRK